MTAFFDFIIPADYYNQTPLITCQHYAHCTLYYNMQIYYMMTKTGEKYTHLTMELA
jgi:hypothetical protein